mmetsp:Transcript_8540/g.31557  ORF Transcript_8540/g.31557 Transcript_8540/m.31557 type:complete len:325 (+) Transcript_8540:116-1090(+)
MWLQYVRLLVLVHVLLSERGQGFPINSCDADRLCYVEGRHEQPTAPSPRTQETVRGSFSELINWRGFQAQLKHKASVEAERERRERERHTRHGLARMFGGTSGNEGTDEGLLDILFVGDSITEQWLGTSYGRPRTDREEVRRVFEEHFGKYRTLVLAISGDQTQHLLWRLDESMGGELPAGLQTKAVVLLIGTNNLSFGHHPREAAQGAVSVASLLRHRFPDAKLLVNTLMPRGPRGYSDICPEQCSDGSTPYSDFEAAIQVFNEVLVAKLRGLADVEVVDCSGIFAANGEGVNLRLMPDALHPNGLGADRWAQQCLLPALNLA